MYWILTTIITYCLMEVVFWPLTYSISLTNKACKHDTHQGMKFVFWYSTNTFSVLNRWLNMTRAKSRNSFICDRLWVCAEYGLKIWLSESNEIRVLKPNMHHISPQSRFRTLVAPIEIVCFCDRLTAYLFGICAPNMTRSKWWIMCIGTRHLGLFIGI
jgi:hypothetical protein